MKRLLGLSITATMITLLLGMLSFAIPYQDNWTNPHVTGPIDTRGKVYSEEELRKSDAEMRERLDQSVKNNAGISAFSVYQMARERMISISWMPWIIIPFLFKGGKGLLLMLSPLGFFALIGLILPSELVYSSLALFIGWALSSTSNWIGKNKLK